MIRITEKRRNEPNAMAHWSKKEEGERKACREGKKEPGEVHKGTTKQECITGQMSIFVTQLDLRVPQR